MSNVPLRADRACMRTRVAVAGAGNKAERNSKGEDCRSHGAHQAQ